MKLQASELFLGKPLQPRRIKTPKFAPILITFALLFTIIPLYYPSLRYNFNSNKISEPTTSSFHSLPDSTTTDSLLDPDPEPDLHQNNDQPQQQTEGEESEPHKTPEIEPAGLPTSRKNSDERTTSDNGHVQEQQQQQRTGTRKKRGRRERRRPSRSQRDSPSGTGLRRERREKVSRRIPNLSGITVDQNKDVIPAVVDSGKLIDKDEGCDLFTGEWVPNPDGPYYTNETCWAIQEHQNCMKFERPDTGFLKWRWKPDGCDLPIFDPNQFLELLRGKSIAFVGDSVARNHMQSLICLLSKVVYPIDVLRSFGQNQRWVYKDYNFNVSMFWAPYLVRTERTDPNDATRPFNLYLDEFDEEWTSNVGSYDYIIISAGHWFFRPTMFYVGGSLAGCLYCPQENVTHLTSYFSYRRAFRTALRAINSLDNFKGVTFLRTFAPSHFEGGPWDKGGDCVRTRPLRRDEKVLDGYNLEMYNIQLQELAIAQKEGRRKGTRFKLFDATKSMLLRPDGHPSKYGHWQNQSVSMANDCVHWCLPGPIDAWNDFLFELLRREDAADRSFVLNFIHS